MWLYSSWRRIAAPAFYTSKCDAQCSKWDGARSLSLLVAETAKYSYQPAMGSVEHCANGSYVLTSKAGARKHTSDIIAPLHH
jgi:hypothetical protein